MPSLIPVVAEDKGLREGLLLVPIIEGNETLMDCVLAEVKEIPPASVLLFTAVTPVVLVCALIAFTMAARLATRSDVNVTEMDVLLMTIVPVAEVAGDRIVGWDIVDPGRLFPASDVTYCPILIPVN
jgi:hypothetical protein